jgi:hypothetical protein
VRAAARGQGGGLKIRNSKIGMLETEIQRSWECFRLLGLEFVSDFEIRISDLKTATAAGWHCPISPNPLEPESQTQPTHETQTANPPRVHRHRCPVRATRSFRCDKEVTFAGRQNNRLSGSKPIAFHESYAVPRSFGSDNAAHLLSWNDLGRRSKGEDLYHRREANIARV